MRVLDVLDVLLDKSDTMLVGQQCTEHSLDTVSESLFPSSEVTYGDSYEERTY